MGLFSRRRDQGDDSDRERSWAAYERGQALVEQKRWEEAAEEFATASGLVPESVPFRLSLGAALSNSGRAREALELLQVCLREHPDHDDVRNSVAMALGKLGRYEEAAVHLVHAARLGHLQATQTMRRLNMDYCRRCNRPVYRSSSAQADVRVVESRSGMQCVACHEVYCIPCLREETDSIIIPPCPRCGGGVVVMDIEAD